MLVLAGALWVLVGGMGGSRKEGDFLRRHAACRRDRQRFCGHVRHLVPVLGCMRDHETELEPACSASLKKCPAYKCSRDAMRLCPHVRKHDQILSCMWRNRQVTPLPNITLHPTYDSATSLGACRLSARARLTSPRTSMMIVMCAMGTG